MKNYIITLLFLVLVIGKITGQYEQKEFSNYILSAEVNTLVLFSGSASMNAEFRLHSSQTNRFHTYARVGFGKGYTDDFFTIRDEFSEILMGLTFLLGSRNSHFEINTGIYLLSDQEITEEPGFFNGLPDERGNILPIFHIGYRFQRPQGGLIFSLKIGTFGFGGAVGYAF